MKTRRTFPKSPGRQARAARRWLCLAVALISSERQARVLANPTGLSVGAGAAWAQTIGARLNVTVGPAALLNWSAFNIQAGETTTFLQPSANSVVVNVIGDKNPSQIFGSLNANGTVILANANGFYFGPNSMVKVGGDFIATTAPLTPDFGAGSAWTFTGLPPLASIVNYGQIQAGNGHSLYLIAENIENHGTLNAPAGDIGLYGGESVLVSESPDGRGLSATVKVPQGAVDNLGRITADAGTIAMQAQVVNQNGLLQANSVREENGVIELVAGDTLNLGPNSTISAEGDDSAGGSAGGSVTLKAGGTFSDSAGSQITTAGGAQGGNGGTVEVSAPNFASLDSSMNGAAASGWTGGELLLDPINITLTGSGASTTTALPGSGGTVNGSATPAGATTWSLNVDTAFANKNFSQITLEASGNITVGTAWNLSNTTGETGGLLTLEAGQNILFSNGAQIKDVNDWSVALYAGVGTFSPTQPVVTPGAGSIYIGNASPATVNGQTVYTPLNNTGSIWTGAGSISLTAGEDIMIGSGYVITKGGGGITLDAVNGSINAGTANAYNTSLLPVANPSGINTYAGGDVTLTAGNSISSIPTASGLQIPGSSGTYGAGNVTLTAGDLVEGNFQVAAGTGTILAGAAVTGGAAPVILNDQAMAGTAGKPLSLSLTSGAWEVDSGGSAFIEEVRNLSGAYGSSGLYTYAPNAAFNLWAGNGITLVGLNLTGKRNGEVNAPVYPPVMSLTAGPGGITLNNAVVLYPSAAGSLQITTTGGGSLMGTGSSSMPAGITMSDGNPAAAGTFSEGYSAPPLHAGNPNPVVVNISGNVENFNLNVPTFANITVGGNAMNFNFVGENLSASQTTSITVAGSITYRGDLTSEPLAAALPAALLNPALSGLPAELVNKLFYDATTGTLTFVGAMSAAELAELLNPTVVELDAYGQPVLDANNNPVLAPVTLTAGQIATFNQLYAASQSATLNDQGLGLTGPGHFNISAASIDLATATGGIYANTIVPVNPALAQLGPVGADINVTTTGNLAMTETEIANAGWRGNINLYVGGALEVGGVTSTISLGDADIPKGIFTESEGNILVEAQGDVEVNSSRIGALNGGNVTVESVNGSVDAGNGGTGSVNVDAVQLDPATGDWVPIPTVGIGGSGILATTIPGADATLGNILVESPRGDITASEGGILQIGLNGTYDLAAIAALISGYELRASTGNAIQAAALGNPRVQGLAQSSLPVEPAQTVSIGGQFVTVSAPVWSKLETLLGVTPAPGQVLSLVVTKDQAALISALNNGGAGLEAFTFTTLISPARNVNASGSGIVAQNVVAKATGEVNGLFVGFNSVSLDANVIGPGIAFGPTVNITQSSPNENESGPTIQVISESPVSVNGVSEAPTAPQTTGPAAEVSTTTEDQNIQAAKTGTADSEDDARKKKGEKEIGLVRKVSRVTVLLPQRD